MIMIKREDYLEAVESMRPVDAPREKQKIKTTYAEIIVGGTKEKPYYNIRYYDPEAGEIMVGFGSYYLDNVWGWLSEEFEIIKPEEGHNGEELILMKKGETMSNFIRRHKRIYGYNSIFTRHAYWRVENDCSIRCSRCCFNRANIKIPMDYCPNCGAKMDEASL